MAGIQKTDVTTRALRDAATKVDDSAKEYYNGYRAFLDKVKTVTSADWKGPDASAFNTKVASFEGDFNKMKQLMEQYAQFLRDAATNYEATQDNIQQQINALQGGTQ